MTPRQQTIPRLTNDRRCATADCRTSKAVIPHAANTCGPVRKTGHSAVLRVTGRLATMVLMLLSLCALLLPPVEGQARPRSMEDLAAISGKLVETGVSYGAIPSLYRPRYDRTLDADLNTSADEVVFVVMLPGGPRIYLQRYMVWHQVVNELIDDVAYTITYCPTTGTLMAYNASLGGLNLIFDVEGRLYDGNSVLIDRNSGSLWLQETGMAFEGPLMGRGLPTIPVFWTSWGAARSVFPQASVMAKPAGNRPYGRDPYGSYQRKDTYYDNDRLIYPVERLDRRFPRKTHMLCLEYENYLLALDVAYVKKKGTVNFFVGPHALLAVHDPHLDVVRVFNRQIWAEPFLFVSRYGKLMDLKTRSIWDPATGKALEGNMKGAAMPEFFGGYSMWFAWYSINPETLTVPGPGEVPENLLSPDAPGHDSAAPGSAAAPAALTLPANP